MLVPIAILALAFASLAFAVSSQDSALAALSEAEPANLSATTEKLPDIPPPSVPMEPQAAPQPQLVEGDPGAERGETAVTKYVVVEGDTAGEIAERFGISVDTIVQANDLVSPGSLKLGQELLILPVSGVLHTLASGDSLTDLSGLYGVSAEDIAAFNGIRDPDSLQAGEKLVVPGGKIQLTRTGSSRGGARPGGASGTMQWPTTGSITTTFSAGHRGIDIAAPSGVPVYAADGGTITTAVRQSPDYGNYLIVDHGNGRETLYAHLSVSYVESGEKVTKGERIGAIGSTGLSTGPHLHFEVWEGSAKLDPFNYLP